MLPALNQRREAGKTSRAGFPERRTVHFQLNPSIELEFPTRRPTRIANVNAESVSRRVILTSAFWTGRNSGKSGKLIVVLRLRKT